MTYTIYADNLVEKQWFADLSPLLKSAQYSIIGSRNSNPPVINNLIRYDRPDIVLLIDGRPVLVVEKTREVPTGHNVGQRFARLVRAVEEGVPTIMFFPFDARKHGDYTSICNLNIRLLEAFKRMQHIHQVPILAINWPCDSSGELIDNGSENIRISAVVDDYLRTGCNHNCREFQYQLSEMDREYKQRLVRYPDYSKPPGKSVAFLRSADVLRDSNNYIRGSTSSFASRANTLIYKMGMQPQACRREDPYTGTQFIYDYLWCRSGPAPEDKHTNLVLQFPFIERVHWYKANPNDSSRKSCNWYLTANALWFKDGFDIIR